MENRIKKLMELLPADIDGVYITSPENRFYYTGFPSSAGCLLALRGGSVFYTDSRYFEAAQNKITSCEVWLQKDLFAQINEQIKACGAENFAVEAERMPYAAVERLRQSCPNARIIADGRADSAVSQQRMIKSGDEVEKIIFAQRIAERAFDALLERIRPGMTEREVALELDYNMLRNGAQGLSFETIAVSGENSSLPHGVPGERRLREGDFLTLDFGAVYEGYHSDMTRTVAIGEPSKKQRLVYETVLRAQKAALEELSAGVDCAYVDAAARRVIAEAGFGDYFNHSTGHGVGVEIHESPNLSPKSVQKLAEGMVVTVEPGVYIPREFGVRIEDMALITANGHENLTKTAKELTVLQKTARIHLKK